MSLAERVCTSLLYDTSRLYAQRVPLPWVEQYISLPAVRHVLCGVASVLRLLGVVGPQLHSFDLEAYPAEELVPYWIAHLQANMDSSTRALPDLGELQNDTIRDISSGINALANQTYHHYQVLKSGEAPGVQEFPKIENFEAPKSQELPFAWAGAPTNSDGKGYLRYASLMATLSRRPGPREVGNRVPTDTVLPSVYF